jgi:hypothetical protein
LISSQTNNLKKIVFNVVLHHNTLTMTNWGYFALQYGFARNIERHIDTEFKKRYRAHSSLPLSCRIIYVIVKVLVADNLSRKIVRAHNEVGRLCQAALRKIDRYRTKRLSLSEQKKFINVIESNKCLSLTEQEQLLGFITQGYNIIACMKLKSGVTVVRTMLDQWTTDESVLLVRYMSDTRQCHSEMSKMLLQLSIDVANEVRRIEQPKTAARK